MKQFQMLLMKGEHILFYRSSIGMFWLLDLIYFLCTCDCLVWEILWYPKIQSL